MWKHVLDWTQIHHAPLGLDCEREWLSQNCKGKSWRANILKCAATESIYVIWRLRNDRVFKRILIDRGVHTLKETL